MGESTDGPRLSIPPAAPEWDRRPRRSRLLNLLAWGLAGMGLVNLGRAWQSHRNLVLLEGWEPSLSPAVLLALSLGWAALFAIAARGLMRRRGWARQLTTWLVPAYGVYSAGSTLVFARSPYARHGWLLVAVGWAVASLFIRWLLTRGRFRVQFSVG